MQAVRAARVYRALLRLGPARLREDHGAEMESLFLRRFSDARSRPLALAWLWIRAAADILAASARDRGRTGRLRRERRTHVLGADIRSAFRSLVRQKLSSALVLAMLATGIAANVAVFGLVNGLFLRPFPFPEPDRLVFFNETAPKWNLEVVGINFPDFHQWRRAARLFDAMTIVDEVSFNVSDAGGAAERITGATVTDDYTRVLGVAPIAGRFFRADEDRPGGPRVVVIGEGLWKERFGGAGDVVGRSMRLDGVPHTVVGVLPAEAEFPAGIRLWTPLAGDPNQEGESYSYSGIGRLKPGVDAEEAEADLRRAHAPIWDVRDKERVVSPFVRPLREQFAGEFRPAASALVAAVALLLIVACANVASVMLARALARRREMGIRLAIGASRARLARQLFVESIVLATLGGAIGLGLGHAALRALLASAGELVPPWATFALDWRVIAFAAGVAAGTTILFGWAPALHAIRGDVRAAMQPSGAGATAAPSARRTLSGLVGAEFALAAVLLVCGGLLLRAYDRVQRIDPGFTTDNVLTFALALPDAAYPDAAARLAFWERLQGQLGAHPGVSAAGVVNCPPLTCHWGSFFLAEGAPPRASGEANPVVLNRIASVDYFRAMGVRLRAGRLFDEADGREAGNRVIVVNETFVRTFLPGVADPVGRRVRRVGTDTPWITIVGVVADVRHYGLERPMRPGIYLPLPQIPNGTMSVAVRTTTDAGAFAAEARALVRRLDPELALYRVRTMEEALARSLANRAIYSWLLAVFAGMTLLLALGGTYGVTTYLVTQRTREIGIRVALGASGTAIVRAVLRTSLVAVAAGVALGVVGAIAMGRLLSSLLFGVSPADPSTLVPAAAALLAAALAANWAPAWRAARVDPMSTLRAE
jgi:putative ABC transport system permease protein